MRLSCGFAPGHGLGRSAAGQNIRKHKESEKFSHLNPERFAIVFRAQLSIGAPGNEPINSGLYLDSLGEREDDDFAQTVWVTDMSKEKSDLLYGTLDMLILRALQHGPRHGLGIADRIQQISQEILRVEQGSLYPALYRLEAQGWIKAEWGVSDNNRKARFYKLTAAGRKQLAAEREHWSRIVMGIIVFWPMASGYE